ncbi:MAG: acyl-CoA dehydratase activase [Pseudomonadota bacterium]
MSIVAGCDIGSLTAKAVIMENGRIISSALLRSKTNPQLSAEAVMKEALSKTALSMDNIQFFVGTGYGRKNISFVNQAISEIACHGKGARWLIPGARTIIDIGGQDCKAVRLDQDGNVVKFVANDKCASGTGRFLEVMARLLNISIEELGGLSSRSTAPIILSSTCTVWAQADIIKYINSGHKIEDIGAGVNSAMAKRAAILANSVGIEPDVCMTGGVAKNEGVVRDLEKLLGKNIKRTRKADPQIAGAIGAAIFAMEKANGRSK